MEKGKVDFKIDLIEIIVFGLKFVRDNVERIYYEVGYVDSVLYKGVSEVEEIVEGNLDEIKKKIGLR